MAKKIKNKWQQSLLKIGLESNLITDDIEKNELVQKWKIVFCRDWLRQSPKDRNKSNCDFDLMNRKYYSNDAIKAYDSKRIYTLEFFIRVQDSKDKNKILSCNGKLPSYKEFKQIFGGADAYIIPDGMEWTFVITHEGNYVNDPFFDEI